MKYTTVLAFAVGAFAMPQDATITSAPAAAAIPTGLTSAVSCALACDAADVTCQASCLGNARPNASQAIATNECAAKCDQGDGSTEASEAFRKCVDSCINSLFPSSQTVFGAGPAPAAASGASAGASGANSANPTATSGRLQSTVLLYISNWATGSSSASGSPASPQSTGAAEMNSARIVGAGLAGLFAIFAL